MSACPALLWAPAEATARQHACSHLNFSSGGVTSAWSAMISAGASAVSAGWVVQMRSGRLAGSRGTSSRKQASNSGKIFVLLAWCSKVDKCTLAVI
jgi:hypothetical protein